MTGNTTDTDHAQNAGKWNRTRQLFLEIQTHADNAQWQLLRHNDKAAAIALTQIRTKCETIGTLLVRGGQ